MTNWRDLTKARMSARNLTQWDVANAVAQALKRPSFTQATVQSALSGRTAPPLFALEAWADTMALRGAARDEWFATAIGEHLTPTLAATVRRWQARSAKGYSLTTIR